MLLLTAAALTALAAVLLLERTGALDRAAWPVTPVSSGGPFGEDRERPSVESTGQAKNAITASSERLRLRLGASIRGTVISTTGGAVARAKVLSSNGLTVETDEGGRFEFMGLDEGEHWLWAEAAGLAVLPVPPVRTGPGESVQGVQISMAPARFVAGRICSSKGAPVAGAKIRGRLRSVPVLDAARWSSGLETVSSASGTFRLGPLPGGLVELTVTHPDYVGFARLYPSDREDLQIDLEPLAAVFGRVVDATSGHPVRIERAALLVSTGTDDGPWQLLNEPVAVAQEDAARGRFRLRVRTRRLVRAVVEGPTFARVVSQPFRLGREAERGPLWLRARPGVRVRGSLHDDLGHPVSGAQVVVIEERSAKALFQRGTAFALPPVFSGTNGSFLTTRLAPGRYRIEVRHKGYLDLCQTMEVQAHRDVSPLDLVLVRGGSVRGKLRGACGGALPKLHILARRGAAARGYGADHDWSRPVSATVCPEDGTFCFRALDAGTHRLELVTSRAPGQQQRGELVLGHVLVDIQASQETRVELDLKELDLSTVQGTLSQNGVPLPLVEVSLGRSARRPGWSCTTDRSGRFRFSAVPAGTFFLSAHLDPASRPRRPIRVDVHTAGEVHKDLTLKPVALTGPPSEDRLGNR